jgi:hypothetical protein
MKFKELKEIKTLLLSVPEFLISIIKVQGTCKENV